DRRAGSLLLSLRRRPRPPLVPYTTLFRSEDANIRLRGVFGDVDFANQDRFSDALLEKLLAHFEKHRLRNADVPADMLGDAYLYISEEHTSELQSREKLVCRLLLEKKNNTK